MISRTLNDENLACLEIFPQNDFIKLIKPDKDAGLNPLPPSDAVRKQKKIFWRIFSVQYFHNSKNITPLET